MNRSPRGKYRDAQILGWLFRNDLLNIGLEKEADCSFKRMDYASVDLVPPHDQNMEHTPVDSTVMVYMWTFWLSFETRF